MPDPIDELLEKILRNQIEVEAFAAVEKGYFDAAWEQAEIEFSGQSSGDVMKDLEPFLGIVTRIYLELKAKRGGG